MTEKEQGTVQREDRKDKLWQPIAALMIGLVVFLAIRGAKIVRPSYTDWLMVGDATTHWLGWQFFRHTPFWQWPLGANYAYGMELGSSVVFTDSIPLLAILLKPFDAWLPTNFQYLGLWLLSCLCLQSFFASKLLGKFTSDKVLRLVGCAFFTIAPVCLFRMMQGHYALVGQWMILAALCLYFSGRFSSLRWLCLLSMAALVHVYLLVMAWVIWSADLLQRGLQKQASIARLLTGYVIANTCIVLVMWGAGYFMLGSDVSVFGFGFYRLNLVALFDPDPLWSYVLRDQPNGMGDYEGFAFLGLGVLLLAVVACGELLRERAVPSRFRLAPLLVGLVGLTLYAISPNVGFGQTNLIEYHLPQWTNVLTGAFRVSGRLFWAAYYVIYLGIFCVVFSRFKRSSAVVLCSLALLIQVLDSTESWRALKTRNGRAPVWVSTLRSPAWPELGQRYQRVVLVKPRNVADNWMPLAYFAAAHHMTINTGYFARVDAKAESALATALAKAVEDNHFAPDTLYVFENDALWRRALSQLGDSDVAGVVDGIRVLAPGLKACEACGAAKQMTAR